MKWALVLAGALQLVNAQAGTEKFAEPQMVAIPGKNYEIGKYEVTQKQWLDVMSNNPSDFFRCGDNCPVEQVSWNDIQKFLAKLNQKTGKKYRLPTEAEWEYACYGGSKSEYCGGSNVDSVAWYWGNSDRRTHPVGQKQANGYGLYDMSGNVWEWLQDWYDNKPQEHVMRGGSWLSNAQDLRSRIRSDAANRSSGNLSFFGFRLARTIDSDEVSSNKTITQPPQPRQILEAVADGGSEARRARDEEKAREDYEREKEERAQAREDTLRQCTSGCGDEQLSCTTQCSLGSLGKSGFTDCFNPCQAQKSSCESNCQDRYGSPDAAEEARAQQRFSESLAQISQKSQQSFQRSMQNLEQTQREAAVREREQAEEQRRQQLAYQQQEQQQRQQQEAERQPRQLAYQQEQQRQQQQAAQQKQEQERNVCHMYTNQVTAKTRWYRKFGPCDNGGRGELEAFMTNHSGQKLQCRTQFRYPDGSIHDEGLGNISATATDWGGEWGGIWSCAPDGTRFEWKCALSSDDGNCVRMQ